MTSHQISPFIYNKSLENVLHVLIQNGGSSSNPNKQLLFFKYILLIVKQINNYFALKMKTFINCYIKLGIMKFVKKSVLCMKTS